MAQTYAGIKILDLTRTLAGPYASMILADLGADVIKVEAPDGDDTRRLPPKWHGESAAFLALNRNKRSVALDLKSDLGREAVLRLAAKSDVVMESFRPGVMEKLGIGFDTLKIQNPRLIFCSVSAFGRGPIGHDMPGYDSLLQAFSGIMKATGHPGEPPARLGPSAIDLSTGMWAAIQIMAALARRDRMDEPQRLEVALLDSALNLMNHQLIGVLAGAPSPQPQGSGSPITAPYEVFAVADGEILIAAGNDVLYRKLCLEMGRPELIDHPDYATMTGRVKNRTALHETLEATLMTAGMEAWEARFKAAGVPAGPVLDLAAAIRQPVTIERDLLVACPSAQNPDLQLLRLPLGEHVAPPTAPPALGEHTEAVLREIGLAR